MKNLFEGRQAGELTEIEVTPAMVEAGARILYEVFEVAQGRMEAEFLAEEVFTSMIEVLANTVD